LILTVRGIFGAEFDRLVDSLSHQTRFLTKYCPRHGGSFWLRTEKKEGIGCSRKRKALYSCEQEAMIRENRSALAIYVAIHLMSKMHMDPPKNPEKP
jgi:hypothetical protein